MKKCNKCKIYKEESDFYGKQGECKKCTRIRVKSRADKLRLSPDFVKKERKRCRDKYYRLNYKNKSSNNSDRKKPLKNYREKYPEKIKAKIKSQRLEIPKGLEKHHWSYKEVHYKDVICLTDIEHNKLHRYLVYSPEDFQYKCSISIDKFNEGDLLDTKDKHEDYYLSIKRLD